jgi:two-component system, chemotaxis family, chemotaxis protein CheY
MKIMIVDDSGAMRKVIATLLRKSGYTDLVESENGKVAWEALEQDADIGLILLDLNMPVMDGYTFLSKIKADPRYQGIRVVLITTETERQQVLKALKLGVDNYIIKPVNLESFKEKVFPLIPGQEQEKR